MGKRSHPTIDYWGLALVFTTPALGGLLYGYDIGATSFALSMLIHEESNRQYRLEGDKEELQNAIQYWWTRFPKVQQGLFVSGLSLGALLGSHLVLMHLSHMIGRRMEIRISAILYVVGTFFNVLSGTILAETQNSVYGGLGFYSLFIGRLLFGIGVGFIMHGAPAYMAEMCPPQVRGAVVSAKETVIVGGIVLGYAIGNIMSGDPRNWTDLYAITLFVAIPMFLLTFRIPRSKRWLLLHGYRQEALESMKFVYKGDIQDIREEFDDMANSIDRTSSIISDDGTIVSPSLHSSQHRPALMASLGLIFFQQFSGQPSVLSYATVLFLASGWSGNASVVTALLMMATSMTTVSLVDRVGRKPLLGACCFVMMTALSALASVFWGVSEGVGLEFEPAQKTVIFIAMIAYIGGYQIGFGPITWVFASEIFSLDIRSKAIALCVEVNYLLNFFVQFTFPILQDCLGWGPTFVLFGIILGFALFFVRLYVPETTGMTLEEIQSHITKRDEFLDSRGSHSQLLAGESTPLLGAVPNIEEMTTHIIRTHSETALPEKIKSQTDAMTIEV